MPYIVLLYSCENLFFCPNEGYGWLTIRLSKCRAELSQDGRPCDPLGGCDPYVKLFIGDEEVFASNAPNVNDLYFNLDVTYTSQKIQNTSNIKIEVWDADDGLNFADDLIMSQSRSVDSWLYSRYIVHHNWRNNFQTSFVWLDERI